MKVLSKQSRIALHGIYVN